MTGEISLLSRSNQACKRLMGIPAVGPIISTALVAAVGDATSFRRGRDLALWLGLVPRQHSSGGKQKLLDNSKRGNQYLRKTLLEGARSAFARHKRQTHNC